MSKNGQVFLDMTQERFARFMTDATKLSAELEPTMPSLSAMIDELMELAMRIRTLRQYCVNSGVAHGGKMMVDAERVVQILDGA